MEQAPAVVNDDTAAAPKTPRQLEKEQKKKAKLEKFLAKSQQAGSSSSADKKQKEKSKGKIEAVKYEGKTLPGEKKDLSQFPPSYSPSFVEAAWYGWWQKQGYFKPEYNEAKGKEPYVILFPPPNVTGTLHLGHALTCTLQDSLARYHRMQGRPVLWVPGCDHAGIATQVVVEKRLWRDCKKTRFDLGRTEFISKVWEWKQNNGDRIYEQTKLMGSSFDWDRAVFTMDEMHSKAVEEAFIRLYDAGQIYRAARIVNWSVSLQSVISDIEVEKVPVEGKTWLNVPGYEKRVLFGCLTGFVYKIIGGGEIEVATTRLETMLGDVAISVHPDDERYKQYHGKFAQHPFFPDRKLIVVTDEEVDMGYGTGAVKISPGHDLHDFEIAKRYKLPIICCIDDDGRIANGFGEASGMKRFDARGFIAEKLAQLGLLRDTHSVNMVIPICGRSKDVIEPLVKPQWFVRMKADAMVALDEIQSGHVKVFPERYVNDCARWLSNCRDWCVSRQLWWGHQVPAYRIVDDGNERWVCAHDEEKARTKAKRYWPHLPDGFVLERDQDVLDTWFSSSIFPFSVFGWPDETDDLRKYYPGTLLETGHDILFFWVIRMIVMSLKLNGKVPFSQVYLHGLIRDSHGRKMSKSLGNIIDPLDVIRGISLQGLHESLEKYNLDEREIEVARKGQKADFPNGVPECGADALRFAFIAYSTQASDINLDVLRIQGYRHFCNKIWQAFRFAVNFAFPSTQILPIIAVDVFNCLPARWILSRLAYACKECVSGFEVYDFARVSTSLYNFWLYELCDVFIELVKPHLKGDATPITKIMTATLYACLDCGLRLLHPIMPFLTEELYQRLPPVECSYRAESLCIAEYPNPDEFSPYRCDDVESSFTLAQCCITRIRRIRKESDLRQPVTVWIDASTELAKRQLRDMRDVIACLSCSERVELCKIPEGLNAEVVNGDCRLHVCPKEDVNGNGAEQTEATDCREVSEHLVELQI